MKVVGRVEVELQLSEEVTGGVGWRLVEFP